jgi:8-amino-7-oxononanoate synthase
MTASPGTRPQAGTWLAGWLEACAELDRLQAGNPMLDAVIEEIDGRRIRVGDRWLIDFASCNYLGLDLDREVIEGIPAYLDRWGTHPGWSRMLGSPVLYEQIEAGLRELLGVADVLLLPTLTHIHAAVIPVLASDGTIFVTREPTRRSGTAAWRPGPTARPWSATPTTTPRTSSGCCAGARSRRCWSAWTGSTR